VTAEEFRQVVNFENSLKIGDTVMAHWTNCGYDWAGKAEVVAINRKSFGVRLIEDVGDPKGMGYPAGQRLNIPRLVQIERWSVNNRLAPIPQED